MPLFTIVVPTYHRPASLRLCLEALARLHAPAEGFEVVVVDDGSPEPIEPVVADFQRRMAVSVIRQANAGPAAARNTGAARARGRLLAFTDDDCAPSPTWLTALAAAFQADPNRLLGGRTLNALPENPFATASQQRVSFLYRYHNADPRDARHICSNNMAMPAERFRAIGGFDASFRLASGEDIELCDRWRHHGHRITYVPDAVVSHAHWLTFRAFWRQHTGYGRGVSLLRRRRAGRREALAGRKSLSFYRDLLRFPFAVERSRRPALHAALLGVSQIASTVGLWWEELRQLGAGEGPPDSPEPVRRAAGRTVFDPAA